MRHDTTVSSNVFLKGHRLKYKVYPNGREIHMVYDGHDTVTSHSSIDDAISRVNKISDGASGSPGDAIVSYGLLGSGRAVVRDYPTPQVSLDHYNGSWSESTSGLDRFGRFIRHAWTDYGADPDAPVVRIDHAYDRASNRLHAHNQTHPSASQKYAYDDLHRLAGYDGGQIKSDQSGVESHWLLHKQGWTLDQVGNHLAVDNREADDYVTNTPNNANEYTARQVKGMAKFYRWDDFGSFGDTSAQWTKIDGDDSFTVNNPAGFLRVTGLGSNNKCILLLGADLGPADLSTGVRFPTGTQDGEEAGIVFGYKSADDYWLLVYRYDSTQPTQRVYHVVNGSKQQQFSANTSITLGAVKGLQHYARRGSLEYLWYFNFTDGYPSGRIGVYAERADTDFDYFHVSNDAHNGTWAGRWINNSTAVIDATADAAKFAWHQYQVASPVLLRGVRVERFQATFSLRRSDVYAANCGVAFVFNASDQDHYNVVQLFHYDTAYKLAPYGYKVVDGASRTMVASTRTDANVPDLGQNDTLWVRVISDGTDLKVLMQEGASEPSDGSWNETNHKVYESDDFELSGGMIGFQANGAASFVDDLTLKADRDENGSFETTEHVDNFTLDGGGYGNETPTYDPAGNLTYDGVFRYTYDAWNRLVTVTKGYRDGGGTLQSGSLVATMLYDGLGRRIMKTVSNSADWDCPYHYYYDGQNAVETRNGSGQVLKQQVWGITYVDELVQVAVNSDPGSDSTCDAPYWALADANYNVAGLVDGDGLLVERYEYTPYGQRTVFISPGDNDVGCYAPTLASRRHVISTVAQPWGLCEFGHQGLMHDEETGLVYNRARILNPPLARFNQTDPLGYVDGMNVYAYCRTAPITWRDPTGRDVCGPDVTEWFVNDLNAQLADLRATYAAIDSRFVRMTMALPLGGSDKADATAVTNVALMTAQKLAAFRDKAAYDLSYKWMNFGTATGKCYSTVELAGVCVRKNQLGNIAFGLLAHAAPPPGFSGDSAVAWAYNREGYDAGVYGGVHKGNFGGWADTPRGDNLVAFAIGAEIAPGPVTAAAIHTAFAGNLQRYGSLNAGMRVSDFTWIPEYGGFDCNKCARSGKTWSGRSAMQVRKELENEWKRNDREVHEFGDWLNYWYENYWGPDVLGPNGTPPPSGIGLGYGK